MNSLGYYRTLPASEQDAYQWLDERGIAWSWENEFSGEIHGGEDRYERLTDLMQGGHRAESWFGAWVLPAIEAYAKGQS